MSPIPTVRDEIFVPPQFKEGGPIEHLILISDVDGVVREGVHSIADRRVIERIQNLLQNKGVDVTFISGTPIDEDHATSLPWREGNLPLRGLLCSFFEKELAEGRVSIFGALGAQGMRRDQSVEMMEGYLPEISFELQKLLLKAFFKEVAQSGSTAQVKIARKLEDRLDSFSEPKDSECNEIVAQILEHLDPKIKLLRNPCLIETHTSNPTWGTSFSFKWLKEEMNKPQYLASKLSLSQKVMATGIGQNTSGGFNYLLIGKTNKGIAIQKHLQEKLKAFPNALVVTLGDTQVDFPMHEHAHLAFHVGLEQVWKSYSLPQCILIRSSDGRDSQHVEGTLKVLELLQEGIGKPFNKLKFLPKREISGSWKYYCLEELG